MYRCISRFLLAVAFISLLTITALEPVILASAQRTATPTLEATPSFGPQATPISELPLPGTPASELPAVVGIAPTPISTEEPWPVYENSELGLALQFPRGWSYVESPDRTSVTFYPPEGEPGTPTAVITIAFFDGMSIDPAGLEAQGFTMPRETEINGFTAYRFDDADYVLPTQNTYVTINFTDGVLAISATRGPATNLVPVLDQIIPSIRVNP